MSSTRSLQVTLRLNTLVGGKTSLLIQDHAKGLVKENVIKEARRDGISIGAGADPLLTLTHTTHTYSHLLTLTDGISIGAGR